MDLVSDRLADGRIALSDKNRHCTPSIQDSGGFLRVFAAERKARVS
jgi:hypothetical protein